MSTRFWKIVSTMLAGLGLFGCPESGSQHAGEVSSGEATQVVPLYETTSLVLWDEPCYCAPFTSAMGGTGEDYCRLPSGDETAASLGFALAAPGGTDAAPTSSCSISTTFQLEEDTTGLSPNAGGMLVVDLSHWGAVGEAYTYQIFFEVRFRGESGTIDTRTFVYCQEHEVEGVTFCWGGEPYSEGSETVEISHLFEAGRSYSVEISVFGEVYASSLDANAGGEIMVNLDVTSLRVEF